MILIMIGVGDLIFIFRNAKINGKVQRKVACRLKWQDLIFFQMLDYNMAIVS